MKRLESMFGCDWRGLSVWTGVWRGFQSRIPRTGNRVSQQRHNGNQVRQPRHNNHAVYILWLWFPNRFCFNPIYALHLGCTVSKFSQEGVYTPICCCDVVTWLLDGLLDLNQTSFTFRNEKDVTRKATKHVQHLFIKAINTFCYFFSHFRRDACCN